MECPDTRNTPLYEAAFYLMSCVYEAATSPPGEPLSVISDELRQSASAIVVNAEMALNEPDAEAALHLLSVTRGKVARLETCLIMGRDVGEFGSDEVEPLFAAALRVRDEIATFGGR